MRFPQFDDPSDFRPYPTTKRQVNCAHPHLGNGSATSDMVGARLRYLAGATNQTDVALFAKVLPVQVRVSRGLRRMIEGGASFRCGAAPFERARRRAI